MPVAHVHEWELYSVWETIHAEQDRCAACGEIRLRWAIPGYTVPADPADETACEACQ